MRNHARHRIDVFILQTGALQCRCFISRKFKCGERARDRTKMKPKNNIYFCQLHEFHEYFILFKNWWNGSWRDRFAISLCILNFMVLHIAFRF